MPSLFLGPPKVIVLFLKQCDLHRSHFNNESQLQMTLLDSSLMYKISFDISFQVAFMTICLWFMAWTPYLILSLLGVFSDRSWLTPMTSIWGAVFAKAGSAYNPIVYGISHPKYRAALHDKFPCLKCGSDSSKGGDSASTVAEGDKGGE